jgi:preprotein translocase subunit SecG
MYSMIVMGVCCVQIYMMIVLMKQTEPQGASARISMLSIGSQVGFGAALHRFYLICFIYYAIHALTVLFFLSRSAVSSRRGSLHRAPANVGGDTEHILLLLHVDSHPQDSHILRPRDENDHRNIQSEVTQFHLSYLIRALANWTMDAHSQESPEYRDKQRHRAAPVSVPDTHSILCGAVCGHGAHQLVL